MLDALNTSSWRIFPQSNIDVVQAEEDLTLMARSLQTKILTGRYHTILLNDYFCEDIHWDVFCQDLVRFYEQGGTVILHASNTCIFDKTNKYFGTQWDGFAYFRAVHSQTAAGKEIFPEARKLEQFSVKSNMMHDIPEKEKLWCTAANRTQSMVPMMAGNDAHPGSTSVAMHEGEGGGRVFFFGDVNWEPATLELMQLACKKASQRSTTTSRVTAEIFEKAVQLKTDGNGHFAGGRCEQAVEKYSEALKLLGHPQVSAHREEASKIASNLAQVYLAQKDYLYAHKAATDAIGFDARNYKALFRRAKALESLSFQDFPNRFEDAIEDLEECLRVQREDGAAISATTSYLSQLRATAKSRPKNTFERNFQKTMFSQGLGSAFPSSDSGQNASAWATGLSEAEKYEWLVDCYRMRVDDDYAWGGGNLHGLYNGDASNDEIVCDFWVFCKQAKEVGAVPSDWQWDRFLDVASNHLRYAFEKEDATEKWGGENVFSAMMGGRSLRFTAEQIYGSSIQAMEDSTRTEELNDHIASSNFFQEPSNFDGLGGAACWNRLRRMPCPQY